MKLSVVIPVHNEDGSIKSSVIEIYSALSSNNIPHEILVVNDNSKDNTEEILKDLKAEIPTLTYINNQGPGGFGYAVRAGLENFSGDCVAIMMGDMSDSPEDLVKFYRKICEGYDCVFGSRFVKGGRIYNYPRLKLIINRIANSLVQICFGIRYNDTTNAFKLYKKETINGLKPFLSPHFNLTLELPLKAIVRGYSYTILPNSWTNRKSGKSKLKIREMGSRYFFILLYCLIERFFSKGDFKKDKW
ncbi:MAG TPA: glycosyltransferase family 2 protein [Chitinophagaceae bacterium]|nr:glycosyltransferase family 2 protein [Chitinophagaceae bacterium]